MKLSFRLGRRIGWNRRSREQQDVVQRLEQGEISEQEAERMLGSDVRGAESRLGDAAVVGATDPEDARARELVERIAREVDEETRR